MREGLAWFASVFRFRSLLHAPTMADDERLTGQRVRREGREKYRRFGDVLDRGELAVHRLLEHHVADDFGFRNAERVRLLRDLLFDQWRSHEAGADDIGTHAIGGAFFRHHLGQTSQTVLGRNVRRLERRGVLRMHRAYIYNAAAVLPVHLAECGARDEKRAIQVNGEQLLPLGKFEVDERAHDLDARVAHEDVEPVKRLYHARDAAFHLRFVAYIHGDGKSALQVRVDLGGGGKRRGGVEICNGHLRAFARKRQRDLLADAARSEIGRASC